MAVPQLLDADVDYLMMDFLAEVTMSLLARARMKDASDGFPPDFVAFLAPHLAVLTERGVRVVSNAGGVNPMACKAALEAACEQAGVDLRIAVVEGDDVSPLVDGLRGRDVRDLDSGASLPERLVTANAYLGALPIRAALDAGADIVVTGRCADSALALGVLMHEFGWRETDYDLLAAGSLVGHILECGPQATGGLHTDWEKVPGWHDIGYPVAECRADGSFVLTKPEGTGGLVTPAVAAEQMLYEIGDPAAYVLPDVVADFSHVTAVQAGQNRVEMRGARGRPPTPHYKVSATWVDGFRAVATIAIVGPDAAEKARRTADELLLRARKIFAEKGLPDFSATHIEVLGAEASYPVGRRAAYPREVVLRLVANHGNRAALDLFAREIGSTGLGFSPGTANILGGRPKAAPLVRLFSFLLPKEALPAPTVRTGEDELAQIAIPPGEPFSAVEQPAAPAQPADEGETVEVPLMALAYARSGDKGDSSNVAIIARRPDFLPLLRRELTAGRMRAWFGELVEGPARRFEVPGVHAFNFLMERALAGGGMASPRIDPLAKAFGQMALEMPIAVPRAWVESGLVAKGEKQ